MKRSLHCHRAAGCSLWGGGGELWFLPRHPGHAQEPCAGLFPSRLKEWHREKVMNWLSGALPHSSAQRGFLPALDQPAGNAVGV